MKVLHTGTINVRIGGPAYATYYTLLGLRELGVEAEVLQFKMGPHGKFQGPDVPVHETDKPWDRKFQFAPHYKHDLLQLGRYDIYHTQGIWTHRCYATVDVARKWGCPYVISPRSMLYPKDIKRHSTFFKRLSLKFRLMDDLNRAACIHATCDEELRHCRELGITSPIAVIPNPTTIDFQVEESLGDCFRLGFLGRLDARKNVIGLIRAFAALGERNPNRAELVIIGDWDDADHKADLQNEVRALGLPNVRFTGFLTGEEKDRELSSLSMLAMPSEYENFGNVILEGLVRGIPCLATQGSPWEDLVTHRCGWWIPYRQDALDAAVLEAYRMNPSERRSMGLRGRTLVERKYAYPVVARQMLDLYEWILGRRDRPVFVDPGTDGAERELPR